MPKGLDPADLVSQRSLLGLTQTGMANLLGMSLRAYQAIENRQAQYRTIHRLAVERVALTFAAMNRDPMAAPTSVRADALQLSEQIHGSYPPGIVDK